MKVSHEEFIKEFTNTRIFVDGKIVHGLNIKESKDMLNIGGLYEICRMGYSIDNEGIVYNTISLMTIQPDELAPGIPGKKIGG